MLVLMAVMAACRPPVTSTLDPVLDPEFTTSLEADRILADPLTERVLWTMFDPARATAADGAVGPNQRGYVSIRPQADGACLTLALGVARSDAALIERGQSLLDWVLAA